MMRIILAKELPLTPRYFVLFWAFFIFWCVLVPIYVSEVTPGIYYEEKD
jgi:choline-glycine betaine transporter